jgi:hypothetical protein
MRPSSPDNPGIVFLYPMQRLIALGLSLVIFFASTGVVLSVHACTRSGDQDVALFGQNGCCQERNACCDTQSSRESSPSTIEEGDCCQVATSWAVAPLLSVKEHDKPELLPQLQLLPLPAAFSPVFGKPVLDLSANTGCDPPDTGWPLYASVQACLGIFRI